MNISILVEPYHNLCKIQLKYEYSSSRHKATMIFSFVLLYHLKLSYYKLNILCMYIYLLFICI